MNKSEERARHIVELRKKGVSIEDIADSVGTTEGMIKRTLNVVLRGHKSMNSYLIYLAKNKGHKTTHGYRQKLYEKKSRESLKSRVFSHYVKTELELQEKDQVWLAKETGLSKVSISRYCRGQSVPNDDNAKIIFEALDSKYSSIDELVMDNAARAATAAKASSYEK